MLIAALALAGVAALIHIYIFYMESVAWTGERARRTFGTSPGEAQATRALAFNQGFYNLFLATMAVAGIIAFGSGAATVGATLLFASSGSMAAAALVLLVSSPDKRAAALKQGIVPLLSLIILALSLMP